HAEIPSKVFMHETAFALKTKIAQLAASLSHALAVCQDHSTFTCGDMFVRIEAKDTYVSKRTTWPPFVRLAVHFRGVLNNKQLISSCNFQYWIHIDRQSVGMRDEDCFRSICKCLLNERWIHVPCK